MTVTYSNTVATATLATFGRLLFRWKASVYKLVWRETIIFIIIYVFIALIYQYALTCEQQRQFDGWAKVCEKSSTILPLTFVMGFYVDFVISRWWAIFLAIGWPDRQSCYVSMCLPSPEMLQYRRAIVRYLNLAQLIVLRDVSTSVKTRYPTLDKVVEEGFMTPEERQIYDSVKGENQLERHNRYWLIMQWAINVLCRAYDQGEIRNTPSFAKTFEMLVRWRDKLELTLFYDWISIPLSYTQVVTLVLYVYFFTALVGRQFTYGHSCCPSSDSVPGISEEFSAANCSEIIDSAILGGSVDRSIEMFFPVFPLLEFVFYMGWLKVAESIMNPLGNDDDDFEINYIITRNLAASYAIVDSYMNSAPQVTAETEPALIASSIKDHSFRGSANEYHPSVISDDTRKARLRLKRIADSASGSGAIAASPPTSLARPADVAKKSIRQPDSSSSAKSAPSSASAAKKATAPTAKASTAAAPKESSSGRLASKMTP